MRKSREREPTHIPAETPRPQTLAESIQEDLNRSVLHLTGIPVQSVQRMLAVSFADRANQAKTDLQSCIALAKIILGSNFSDKTDHDQIAIILQKAKQDSSHPGEAYKWYSRSLEMLQRTANQAEAYSLRGQEHYVLEQDRQRSRRAKTAFFHMFGRYEKKQFPLSEHKPLVLPNTIGAIEERSPDPHLVQTNTTLQLVFAQALLGQTLDITETWGTLLLSATVPRDSSIQNTLPQFHERFTQNYAYYFYGLTPLGSITLPTRYPNVNTEIAIMNINTTPYNERTFLELLDLGHATAQVTILSPADVFLCPGTSN